MAAPYTGDASGATPGLTANAVGSAPGVGTNTPALQATANGARSAVRAENNHADPSGTYPTVWATNSATGSGYCVGVWGEASGSGGYGVYGYSPNGSSGVYGFGKPYGVYGVGTQTIGTSYGVYGTATSGLGSGYGLYGSAGTGVYGTGSVGVTGNGTTMGVQGVGGTYSGYFTGGDMWVNSNFSVNTAGGKTKNFVMDHPLDPANRLLLHTCVESPERKQVYDGIGIANQSGELAVQLPTYFEALNTDVRYQITAVGEPAPGLHVKNEVSQGRFIIAGAAPGQKVCWLVTGNRNDPGARMRPFEPEQDKPEDERGYYLSPEAWGQPSDRDIEKKRHPPHPAPPPLPTPPTPNF